MVGESLSERARIRYKIKRSGSSPAAGARTWASARRIDRTCCWVHRKNNYVIGIGDCGSARMSIRKSHLNEHALPRRVGSGTWQRIPLQRLNRTAQGRTSTRQVFDRVGSVTKRGTHIFTCNTAFYADHSTSYVANCQPNTWASGVRDQHIRTRVRGGTAEEGIQHDNESFCRGDYLEDSAANRRDRGEVGTIPHPQTPPNCTSNGHYRGLRWALIRSTSRS
jgi:hypothetical protein